MVRKASTIIPDKECCFQTDGPAANDGSSARGMWETAFAGQPKRMEQSKSAEIGPVG
jgi:hypothetical protein